ncbi:MAG: MinD/ParA family protein [Acholeplasmataceae bacterium]|nr:MinD/ParA family protein [Acholeplasmataceae bacterium]
MKNKIKVLIVDDSEMQVRFKQLFESFSEAIIVGSATTTENTIEKAKNLKPDIILLDLNLPDLDGFAATELLTREVPHSNVILMGSKSGHEELRKAMLAGAKDYIVKPFPSEELLTALKQVYASALRRRGDVKNPGDGKIITIFSPRGGVGKTALTANLGIALASNEECKVAILDCSLQFGDIAMTLNLMPKANIADMVTDIEHLDTNVLKRYMVPFKENLHILPAPFQPERAESITSQHISAITDLLKKHYHYILIDTAGVLNDITLTIMDSSDYILLLSVPDIMTCKNLRLALDTLNNLGYPEDKIVQILNRANSQSGLAVSEMEDILHSKFKVILPNDGKLVLSSLNRGKPFLISNPGSVLSRAVFSLADMIQNDEINSPVAENKKTNKGLFGSFKTFFSSPESN